MSVKNWAPVPMDNKTRACSSSFYKHILPHIKPLLDGLSIFYHIIAWRRWLWCIVYGIAKKRVFACSKKAGSSPDISGTHLVKSPDAESVDTKVQLHWCYLQYLKGVWLTVLPNLAAENVTKPNGKHCTASGRWLLLRQWADRTQVRITNPDLGSNRHLPMLQAGSTKSW